MPTRTGHAASFHMRAVGLFQTSSIFERFPTTAVHQRYEAPDIMSPSGKLLTDGAGKISEDLAHAVASDLGLETCSQLCFLNFLLQGLIVSFAASAPRAKSRGSDTFSFPAPRLETPCSGKVGS